MVEEAVVVVGTVIGGGWGVVAHGPMTQLREL